MNKTYTESIASILEKIEYIEENLRHYATTQMALEDAATTRPAILMLLVSIAEQMNRLEQKRAEEILKYFTPDERKGLRDIRNFIAHEYDGVDLPIVEWLIDEAIPIIRQKCEMILSLD